MTASARRSPALPWRTRPVARPLGAAQRAVLRVLYEAKSHEEAPPTTTEIADNITERGRRDGIPRRSHVRDTAQIRSALKSLTTRGLVRPLGTSSSGARCWEITDEGDRALEATVGVRAR